MTDLKAFAVFCAIMTFRLYIMGTHFKAVTDHNALKALVNMANLEGGLAYWAENLKSFYFEII